MIATHAHTELSADAAVSICLMGFSSSESACCFLKDKKERILALTCAGMTAHVMGPPIVHTVNPDARTMGIQIWLCRTKMMMTAATSQIWHGVPNTRNSVKR